MARTILKEGYQFGDGLSKDGKELVYSLELARTKEDTT